MPFIFTRGLLLLFEGEQSRSNGRDPRVPERCSFNKREPANTPMKKELYLGLDVYKDCIATAVARHGG